MVTSYNVSLPTTDPFDCSWPPSSIPVELTVLITVIALDVSSLSAAMLLFLIPAALNA